VCVCVSVYVYMHLSAPQAHVTDSPNVSLYSRYISLYIAIYRSLSKKRSWKNRCSVLLRHTRDCQGAGGGSGGGGGLGG
jgi:hypothetical protein